VIGIVCMMAALALSFAIPYIFGPRYEASVVYVWALCPWVIITGVRQLGSAVLTTIGNQVIRIRIDLLTLVLSVCMNLLLIPQLGAVASIISLTCAELVSATLAWRFIRDIQSSPGNLSTRRHPRS
jgi:O-antigen/teichoic acid export membrane protein